MNDIQDRLISHLSDGEIVKGAAQMEGITFHMARYWIRKSMKELGAKTTPHLVKMWLVRKIVLSLGECVEGNDYDIIADEDGRHWINHKEVGSGEPFDQFIYGVAKLDL